MSGTEVADFEKNASFQDAVQVRRWDDMGKDPEMKTESLEHFLDYVRQLVH